MGFTEWFWRRFRSIVTRNIHDHDHKDPVSGERISLATISKKTAKGWRDEKSEGTGASEIQWTEDENETSPMAVTTNHKM